MTIEEIPVFGSGSLVSLVTNELITECVFLHMATAAREQGRVPVRMGEQIGEDRKSTFIRSLLMNSFALRQTHGGERRSRKASLLFTRQILTLATLNLHYGGVDWTRPWLLSLAAVPDLFTPGRAQTRCLSLIPNSCPQWKWIMGLGACRARTGLTRFSPSCHRSAHNDWR